MSDNSVPQERPCKVCSRPVIDSGNGMIVHVGGGDVWQKCKNPSCGWEGSQYGGFPACPSCGDGTQLVNDHKAA